MDKKIALMGCLIFTAFGCSNGQNNQPDVGSPLPAVNGGSGSQIYMRAKAEFDISSAPDGSAQFNLVKKSYAAAPNCLHGQCTDFSDITVTNEGSTQFALLSNAPVSQSTSNQNISNLATLKIGTLFDNNLTSCGGKKCISAAIRVYTTDSTGIQGAGLWSQAIGKSVPLTISGGSSAASLVSVPYFSAAGTPDDGSSLQIDLDPLAIDKNVLSIEMADFSDAAPSGAGYTLSANFTQAGAGTYLAHVVVEYDLIGPQPAVYVAGRDRNNNAVYWENGTKVTLDPTGGEAMAILVNGADIYAAGFDSTNHPVYWKNGTKITLDSAGGRAYSLAMNGTNLYVGGFDSNSHAAYWTINGNQPPIETVLDSHGGGINAGISISGSSVYAAGYDSADSAVVWKDGAEIYNFGGNVQLYSMLISGTDVYAGGFDLNSGFVGAYWKNGNEVKLGSRIESIFVNGSDLYVSGYDSNLSSQGCYWKNGNQVALDSINSNINSIFVSGNDIYAAGNVVHSGITQPAYWLNGVEVILDTAGNVLSMAVVIQ
jgi:hypothetical protein